MKRTSAMFRGIRAELILFYLVLIVSNLLAQTPANMLSNWRDTSYAEKDEFDLRYNDVWGFVSNGQEYAAIGSRIGTHIVNVHDPASPKEVAFIRGRASGEFVVHRDYHEWQGYLYAVCDQGNSSLQVIDVSQLPDTAFVVFEDSIQTVRAHNLFVDEQSAKLYTCGNFPLNCYDISDPSKPEFIRQMAFFDELLVEYVHDLYARNDTLYLNADEQGLVVGSYSEDGEDRLLGWLSRYPDQGYNHSGWLNERGTRYYLADETWGMDIKIVDVTDVSQMKVVGLLDAESDPEGSIPHNLIVKDDKLYVSYYFDGLQVFDVQSDTACLAYSYDTDPREPVRGRFSGAWGVYPLLPSGNVLISNIVEGLFVFKLPDELDPVDGQTSATDICQAIISSTGSTIHQNGPNIRYHSGNDGIEIKGGQSSAILQIYSVEGRCLFHQKLDQAREQYVSLRNLEKTSSILIIELRTDTGSQLIKIFR